MRVDEVAGCHWLSLGGGTAGSVGGVTAHDCAVRLGGRHSTGGGCAVADAAHGGEKRPDEVARAGGGAWLTLLSTSSNAL
jgi:hypothetical protein